MCKDKTTKPVVWPGPLMDNVLCGSDQGRDPGLAAPPSLLPAVAPWGPARRLVTYERPKQGLPQEHRMRVARSGVRKKVQGQRCGPPAGTDVTAQGRK